MPAYNFKKEFAAIVESGDKLQTIRKRRKRKTALGDKIYLYSGLRTKNCRRLGIGEIVSVQYFVLFNHMKYLIGNQVFPALEEQNGMNLAKQDGFNTWEEMRTFFQDQYGLPFFGEIIQWRLINADL